MGVSVPSQGAIYTQVGREERSLVRQGEENPIYSGGPLPPLTMKGENPDGKNPEEGELRRAGQEVA